MAKLTPSTAEIIRQSGVAPGSEFLLEVEHVSKTFPGVKALDDVQFRLKRGHVHALMGENGAGKSTLMKIIAGIYTPDPGGSFQLKGQEIRLSSPLDALQYGIAMIHQELNLMNPMTVAENIWIRREPLNGFGLVRHQEMHRRTKELFDRLDIHIDPEAEVRDLSVANRQMVEIAKAVSYNSDILIMDEPTSALTEREVTHLFQIIRALKAQGTGIIYITHKMSELFEIADHVSVFRDGRFVGEHEASKVTRDDIIKLMVGREVTQMFPKTDVPIGDVVLSVRNLTLAGRFRDVSFDLRGGEILGFAGLVGSGRSNVAETLFGVTPATSGKIFINGKEIADQDARRGDGRGVGLPHRGSQGERPVPAARRHGEHANGDPARRVCTRRICEGARDRGALPAAAGEVARAHARSLRAVHQPLRRQSAEGADCALVDDQAAHSHSRRADARHRCRRQGGDPPADLRTRRARAWRS